MKKAVLIPDSFKGTVSSARVCELMAERIEKIFVLDAHGGKIERL